MKALFVIGTRPEAIKLCPVIAACRRAGKLEAVVLSTGQHRDMLVPILAAFSVAPDFDLDVMQPNQTPTGVFARVLEASEKIIKAVAPDWVVVQGDTTTVAALGIAGFYARVPVAHVEAGLRTHNRHEPFPEEINRRLAGVAADLHFAPTVGARDNLLAEGVDPGSVVVTGNTVIDALQLSVRLPPSAEARQLIERVEEKAPAANVVLLTAHRRENHGAPLESICAAVRELGERLGDEIHFVYPVHRNPNVRNVVEKRLANLPFVTLTDPLDYVGLVQVMNYARVVLTDSGGIQEEAPSLGKPVLVLRDVTERPEGIAVGTAKLVGTDTAKIVSEVESLLTDEAAYQAMANATNPYGDGRASERIVSALAGDRPKEWTG